MRRSLTEFPWVAVHRVGQGQPSEFSSQSRPFPRIRPIPPHPGDKRGNEPATASHHPQKGTAKQNGERAIAPFTASVEKPLFGGDGGESNSPSKRPPGWICYKLVQRFISRLPELPPAKFRTGQPKSLKPLLSASELPHPGLLAPVAPHPGVAGYGRSRLRRLERIHVRQLIVCHLINEGDGTSACDPPQDAPVEPARPRVHPF